MLEETEKAAPTTISVILHTKPKAIFLGEFIDETLLSGFLPGASQIDGFDNQDLLRELPARPAVSGLLR
jgi:hypothetical protein